TGFRLFGTELSQAGAVSDRLSRYLRHQMGTIYAIANQKGGVGKTTTAVNAAACVAEAGYPTLLVDVDPQCNATVGLGLAKDLEPSIYDVLAGDAALDDAIRPSGLDGLDVVPSS